MNIDFMKKALDAAKTVQGEVPVGAVIVKNNEIISVAVNKKEELNDVTAHAEILAIKEAAKKIKNWRLNDCDLYVTLEPCPMCMWAILQSRINNLYYGSYDSLYGADTCLPEMKTISNSKINIKGGILEEECDNLLKTYFEKLR